MPTDIPGAGQNNQDNKILTQILGALGQSRISSNINQLARAANSGSLPIYEDVIHGFNEAVFFIKWVRDTLIKGMKLKPQSREDERP